MTSPLDRLVADLDEAFASPGPGCGKRVAALLADYAAGSDDWRRYALFDDACYTRNQIAREERFELLLLCWGAGQESPIHNHEGQDCWMAVLEGRVEEVQYPTPAEVLPGPLTPRGSKVFDPSSVAYISDDIGLHLVRSADPAQAAVSLHLYAAPYDECSCYCPETGRVTRKTLSNHSVRGVLVSS